MGSPPNFENPPWYSDLDQQTLTWFTLGPFYNINLTYADFFTLLLLSYLYKSYHVKKQRPDDSIELPSTKEQQQQQQNKDQQQLLIDQQPNQQENEEQEAEEEDNLIEINLENNEVKEKEDNKSEKSDGHLSANLEEEISSRSEQILHDINAYNEALEEKNTFQLTSWRDRIIYIFCRYSFHFILLFMFMAATVEANVLSCGYVGFALLFLYKDAKLYTHKNKIWRWGRIYNFSVMIIIVIFQFPYFPACTPSCETNCPECDPYDIQPIIGLYKFQDTAYVFSKNGILFDIIIFLLMSFQAVIFDTTIFQRVSNHITEERKFAVYRAKLKYLLFLKKEARAIQNMEEDKKNRIERLEKIHKYRKEKHYLLSKPNESKQSLKKDEEIILKRQSELRNPILGIPEKSSDDKLDDENHEYESEMDIYNTIFNKNKKEIDKNDDDDDLDDLDDELNVPLISESVVEEEISNLYDTIEEFLEPDNESDKESDNNSLTSNDIETKREKLIKYKNQFLSYIYKFYNKFYRRVVKYLYSQTFQHPDANQSKYQVILRGIYYYCLNQSHVLCYLAFILNNLVYANLISLVYPTIAFSYALLESPLPSRSFWRFCIIYTYCIILLKFIFQFSIFCICYSNVNWYFWCIEPFCSSDKYSFCSPSYQSSDVILRDLPELTGITEITGFFALGIGLDLLVLFTLLFHRNISKKSGLWIYLSERDDTIFKRFLNAQDIKKQRKEEKKLKQQEKKEKIKEIKNEKKLERKRQKRRKKLEAKRNKKLKLQQQQQQKLIEDDNIIDNDNDNDDAVVVVDDVIDDNQPSTTDVIDIPPIDGADRDISEDASDSSGKGTPLQDFVAGISSQEEEIQILDENDKNSSDLIIEEEEEEEEADHDKEEEEEKQNEIQDLEDIHQDIDDFYDDDDGNNNNNFNHGEHELEMVDKPYYISSLASKMKLKLHFYYFTLFLHKATAKDYYVPMVSVECLAFFYMVLCQNAFSYNPPDEYSFILLESRIPTSFFFILLIQFLMIVFDRVIYLFRSVFAKVVMQYVSLFYYTLLLFFILPNGQGKQFDEIYVLILFYMMKCCYWWISALQICEGYPVNIQKRWIAQSYGMFHRYLFEVYLAVPFLFELRSLLDWSIFDTTLSFFQWMKLEDIYRNVYQVKCKRKAENTSNWYDKQSWWKKNLVGAIAFIGLIALLWFPLFLLSSANPTNQPNQVVEATFEISVGGYSPFYHNLQDQNILTASSSQFDNIRRTFTSVQGDESSDTQIINLHSVSHLNLLFYSFQNSLYIFY